MAIKRVRATIYGRVQGVAFRAHTQHEATRLGITGWVANRQDGSVQVVAEGQEAALKQLLSWLQHGPPAANVTQVETVWADSTREFHSFQVRY